MKFKVIIQYMSQRNNGWLCPLSEERDKRGSGATNFFLKEQDKKQQIRFSSYFAMLNNCAHTGSMEWIKPLQLVFDPTSSYYNHSPTPVLLGCCQSLGHPPVVCGGAWESVIPVKKKKKKGRPLVCFAERSRLPWRGGAQREAISHPGWPWQNWPRLSLWSHAEWKTDVAAAKRRRKK